ncbi:MAG: alpha/beta hydrolase [Planctomycetaceae bacterium]|jgi:acetyl esterase/lipase|nr:alpha/beta hydrolase [Planctomycetaceae bacterium]
MRFPFCLRATLPAALPAAVFCLIPWFLPAEEEVLYQPDEPAAAVFPLWPGTAPGEKGNPGEEKGITTNILRIENVTVPTLTVYKPRQAEGKIKDTGACVMVCPGGGYNILAYDYEGTEIAGYFNSIGVTAAVLKYRVPRREGLPKHLPALQDAQRGIRILRARAEEWGVDPNRIGVLGFSAGGHLTMMTAVHFDQKTYEPVDAADRISARPDFVMPIYPAYMMENEKEFRAGVPLAGEVTIRKDMPPVFLSVTDDDENRAAAGARVYIAMKEAGVPCELHIFAKGGHGYALRKGRGPAAGWDRLLTDWLLTGGILKQETNAPPLPESRPPLE